jgi:peptidyl-prolyl cis-trans isomerase A (cyclophilin A)
MKSWIALVLFAAAGLAQAQQRVLLDTDRGPILVELDAAKAPNTVANFLRYVDDKRYDNILLYRILKDFIIQGGGYKEDTSPVARFPNIASERNNGLLNTPGTIAMALANQANGQPDTGSANVDFFFNMNTNTVLDPNFTVFGKVVYGMGTLALINPITVNFNQNNQPIRPPLIKRTVRVAAGSFPDPRPARGRLVRPGQARQGLQHRSGQRQRCRRQSGPGCLLVRLLRRQAGMDGRRGFLRVGAQARWKCRCRSPRAASSDQTSTRPPSPATPTGAS